MPNYQLEFHHFVRCITSLFSQFCFYKYRIIGYDHYGSIVIIYHTGTPPAYGIADSGPKSDGYALCEARIAMTPQNGKVE